jgi:acyl-coenzyme A thioesterase PaaI-like protein
MKTNPLIATALVRLYAFFKIPLLHAVFPQIVELGAQRTVLKIPLCRRTKNHLGSMYFGALAIGAEAAIAVKAVKAIRDSKYKVNFVFKDFSAQFLKRAEGNVHFICDQGLEVEALIKKCIQSQVRETQTFESYAVVPSVSDSEKVAVFSITLSVKLSAKEQTATSS